jgi:hypothetical protein
MILTAKVGEAGFEEWYQDLSDADRTLWPLPEALRPTVVAEDDDEADL